MGLDDMLSTIQSDTEDQSSKIISDAKAESEKILSEGRKRADAIQTQSAQQSQREVEEDRNRLLASARLEANRRLLEARDEVLKGYEEQAFSYLEEFSNSPQYKDFFVRMLADALSKIGEGAIVQINPRDKPLLKDSKLKQFKIQVSPEPLKSLGGAIVTSSDGKRRVDNTIESIFSERKDELRLKLSQQVFGAQKS
jgi:V/A-type H+/Na+-transporting ATPase subunit E